VIPAIRFGLPAAGEVLIPDVPVGVYRIEEDVFTDGETELGHLIVKIEG